MLQMRQSMPNNIPSLRKYEVHPVDLPKMWVDCYPSEDTNDSEGGEIMKPTRKEFFDAYVIIMAYIDDEPNSRKLFHSLLSFGLGICNREEEE